MALEEPGQAEVEDRDPILEVAQELGGLEALVSFGETQPLVVTDDRERRNRRTVTEVSGFVSNHPTVLNGKYAEVIFREYVQSATEIPRTSGSGLQSIAAQGG